MSQMISVNIRIDKDIKDRADDLFQSLGVTLSAAVNMFVRQAISEQAIPFQPKLQRKSLDTYLEAYYGKDIETILQENDRTGEAPMEIDWGKPVGDEVW